MKQGYLFASKDGAFSFAEKVPGALLIIIAAIATPIAKTQRGAEGLVLSAVQRCCTENRDNGDCTIFSLKEAKSHAANE